MEKMTNARGLDRSSKALLKSMDRRGFGKFNYGKRHLVGQLELKHLIDLLGFDEDLS